MIKNSIKLSQLILLTLAVLSQGANFAASEGNTNQKTQEEETPIFAHVIGYEPISSPSESSPSASNTSGTTAQSTTSNFTRFSIASNFNQTTETPFEDQLPQEMVRIIDGFANGEITDIRQGQSKIFKEKRNIVFIIQKGAIEGISRNIKVNISVSSFNPLLLVVPLSEGEGRDANYLILKLFFNEQEKSITISLIGSIKANQPFESLELLAQIESRIVRRIGPPSGRGIVTIALQNDPNRAFQTLMNLYDINNNINKNGLIDYLKRMIDEQGLVEKLNGANRVSFNRLQEKNPGLIENR